MPFRFRLTKLTYFIGAKSKTALTSFHNLPVKEEKKVFYLSLFSTLNFHFYLCANFVGEAHLIIIFWQGSKRASNSVAEKPLKKPRKEVVDLTDIDKQVCTFSLCSFSHIHISFLNFKNLVSTEH
jgi:hypothetical protein